MNLVLSMNNRIPHLGGSGVVWVIGGYSSVGVDNKLTGGQASQGQNSLRASEAERKWEEK